MQLHVRGCVVVRRPLGGFLLGRLASLGPDTGATGSGANINRVSPAHSVYHTKPLSIILCIQGRVKAGTMLFAEIEVPNHRKHLLQSLPRVHFSVRKIDEIGQRHNKKCQAYINPLYNLTF